jgi:hypothetical protein
MSSTSIMGTGDSEPQVVSKVEETSSVEKSSASSAMKMVDGEVVSSLEEAEKSKEESMAVAVQEGDIVKESSAVLSESSALKVADGEVLESHQESSFKESDNERNLSEQIDSSDIQETIENKTEVVTEESVKKEIEKEKESSSASSSADEEEKNKQNEVADDELLPPPPSEDFPPPPSEDMMPSVDDLPPPSVFLPPPVDDLPSPTEEIIPPAPLDEEIPPPATMDDEIVPPAPIVEEIGAITEVKQIAEDILPPAPGSEEEADSSTGSRKSYVALVSPTGFVSASRDDTDASRRMFTSSLLSNNDVEGDKLIEKQSEEKLAETKTNGTKKVRNNSGSSSTSDEETNSQVVS